MKHGFRADLHRQGQVLAGLILREGAERFARRSLGLLEELGSILVHIIGFSALRLLTGDGLHYGLPTIPFMVSGVLTYWVFKTTFVQLSSFHAAKPRYLLFPTVTQLDVLIARFAVNMGLYLPLSFCTFYAIALFGLAAPPADIVGVMLALVLAGIWGFGMGLILGGVYAKLPVLRTLSSGFLRIIMYTSGVFFVWPEVPFQLRGIAMYNPFLHLEEVMHESYFQSYHSDLADPMYIAQWIVLCLLLGLVVERVNRRRFSTRGGHVATDPSDALVDDFP